MIIDVHGHLVPPDLLAAIRKESGHFCVYARILIRAANCMNLHTQEPYGTSVPFPSIESHAILMLNSFSGEEPVRAIRPILKPSLGRFVLGTNL